MKTALGRSNKNEWPTCPSCIYNHSSSLTVIFATLKSSPLRR